ncbi:MAG: hypothetical protein ABI548_20055 [Polyangiaceae bacterium]
MRSFWLGGARALVLATVSLSGLCLLTPRSAQALGKQGEFLQTDTLGASLVTHDYKTHTTKDISQTFNLSEFVGLHYYVVDRVRLGMNLQFNERVFPHPPLHVSRLQRFALLPQVGWNFYGPMFGALVCGVVPRTDGKEHLNLTLQAVFGVSLPLSARVRISLAGEVPWTYYDHQVLGVTALSGISIRL